MQVVRVRPLRNVYFKSSNPAGCIVSFSSSSPSTSDHSCEACSLSDIPSLGLAGQVLTAWSGEATIVSINEMATNTFRMRLHCPEMARQIKPGQFFMIRKPGGSDPLLGRPFALYDVWTDDNGEVQGFDFGYLVVGKLTRALEQFAPGDRLPVWGPLGNGFPVSPGGRIVCVAGGIGQTPFLAFLRETLGVRSYGRSPVATDSATICYGVRSKSHLAGVDDFRSIPGLDVQIATDDGTAGHAGYVTELLSRVLSQPGPPVTVYCCGPEPMMRAVQRITRDAGVQCWLSLETPMACGFGACFSCVTRVIQPDGEWDYQRVCVEGPVFDAAKLVLDETTVH